MVLPELHGSSLEGHAAVDVIESCDPCSQESLQILAAAGCPESTFDWLRLGTLLAGPHSGDEGLHNHWQSK